MRLHREGRWTATWWTLWSFSNRYASQHTLQYQSQLLMPSVQFTADRGKPKPSKVRKCTFTNRGLGCSVLNDDLLPCTHVETHNQKNTLNFFSASFNFLLGGDQTMDFTELQSLWYILISFYNSVIAFIPPSS